MATAYQIPAQMGYGNINLNTFKGQHILATTQIQPDPLIAQLIQQMQTMQNQLTAFSVNGKK